MVNNKSLKKYRIQVFQEAQCDYVVEGKNKKDALKNFSKGNYECVGEQFDTIRGIEAIYEEYEDENGKNKEIQLNIEEKDEEYIK